MVCQSNLQLLIIISHFFLQKSEKPVRSKSLVIVSSYLALKRAKDCMSDQASSFKRLNIHADWNHPYSTLDPTYQATVIRAFCDLHKKGYILREHKPIYWSKTTRFAVYSL